MQVDGRAQRTLWADPGGLSFSVLDQRALPHCWQTLSLADLPAVENAIRDMVVRGAPLIGATAAYGLALQANQDTDEPALRAAAERLAATRPSAVNLRWALERMLSRLLAAEPARRAALAWALAAELADADVACN
ncbi:MAG: S-methyl-5-thioribose-1-phosphate isomerase, partial [Rubrivivax sp.]|nr:S-methyl-5-thioribose-1-phosphate isomerase [Rubrivivax sp.]